MVIVCQHGRVDTVTRRLISCTTCLAGPGSNPGAGTVDQAVRPSGVGKLVALVGRWVTTLEYCEC